MKTASTLKTFSGKIKSAMDGETLTPEAVAEIAEEISEVAEVASELAEEIAQGVPSNEGDGILDKMQGKDEESDEIKQLETAQETEEDKKERDMGRDEEKEDLKDKVASLTKDLAIIKRESLLSTLAPKYANLFPKDIRESKLNEILNSKQPLQIIEAKIQEASDIITNKTMIKIASLNESVFNFNNSTDGEDLVISGVL